MTQMISAGSFNDWQIPNHAVFCCSFLLNAYHLVVPVHNRSTPYISNNPLVFLKRWTPVSLAVKHPNLPANTSFDLRPNHALLQECFLLLG